MQIFVSNTLANASLFLLPCRVCIKLSSFDLSSHNLCLIMSATNGQQIVVGCCFVRMLDCVLINCRLVQMYHC